MCCCWIFIAHFEGDFAVFFPPTSCLSSAINYIGILIPEPIADSKNFKEFQTLLFSLMQNSFITIISTLIDTFPPASLYHWKSTSSPEENNFIHWLHLILHSTVERVCVGGQQALYSFLQAASQQTKKHLFNLWKKREELGCGQLLHKREKPPKSASIVWHWRGRWRSERSEQQG